MSYRTIALASCVFVVACGGAAPPPSAAPPSHGAATAPPPPSRPGSALEPGDTGMSNSPDVPEGAPPARAATPAGDSSKPGYGAGTNPKSGINQAAVSTPEPLGGKLTQDDIRRIVESSSDVFGDCYTLGAGGKTKDFKAVVTVKATIGPSGVVNQSEITTSTTKNQKVDACVRDAFKKVKFPRPRDGGTSVITFPVTFNGLEQVQ